MIEEVVSYKLAVGERLVVKKNRIKPMDGEDPIGRISIVTGLHGDELEGQYVCYELSRRIMENRQNLKGIVDFYPALNPLGIDAACRMVPQINMDMNRMFPGDKEGTMVDRVAASIVENIMGSDICLDVHSSDTIVKELPQVRLSADYASGLSGYAGLLNADIIWINTIAKEYEATLADTLNAQNVPTLVIEMGMGNRINRAYGDQIVDGIFNLMHAIGIWSKETEITNRPAISKLEDIDFYRAKESGIFLSEVRHGSMVKAGDLLGKVVDPLASYVKEEVYAQNEGRLFTLRQLPLVYEGGLLARVLRK